MAQWQRVGFQIRRLGVRIPLASDTRSLFLCAATRSWLPLPCSSVPVAQLDKASDYESEDWGFESLQGYYFLVRGKQVLEMLVSELRLHRLDAREV